MAGIGHNSGEPEPIAESGVAAEELKQFVERIERVEAEKQAAADDLKELYSEIKGRGFDTKVLRRIIALRKLDNSSRQEFSAVLQLYAEALGLENVFA